MAQSKKEKAEVNRVWRKNNPDKVKAQKKRYNDNHLVENNIRTRNWRKLNPKKCKGYDLKKNYGISFEEYDEMMELQNYKCAICGEEQQKSLDCDHDHKTGNVRELLCSGCNRGLGNFDDNIKKLQKAIIYLKKHYGN